MRYEHAKKIKAPVKKGDLVMIITGKDKGKTGKVIEVQDKKERVLVENLNIVKKHMKPTQQHRQGGVLEKESPLHWSNVAIVCPKCNKQTRKKVKADNKGNKQRICAKCGEQLESTG